MHLSPIQCEFVRLWWLNWRRTRACLCVCLLQIRMGNSKSIYATRMQYVRVLWGYLHWNSTRPLKNWPIGKTHITKVPFTKSNHDPTQYWQDETTPMHKWLESKWDLEFEHSKTLCKRKAHHEFSPQGAAPPKVCWDTILGAHWQGTRRAMPCHDVFWAPLKCRRFTAGRATDLILHDESLQPCPTQFLPKCAWMCFQIFSDRFHVWLVVFVSHTAKFYGNHFASLLFMSTLEFALFALW